MNHRQGLLDDDLNLEVIHNLPWIHVNHMLVLSNSPLQELLITRLLQVKMESKSLSVCLLIVALLGSCHGSSSQISEIVKEHFVAFQQRAAGENPLNYLPKDLEEFLPYAKTLNRVRPLVLDKRQQGLVCIACESFVDSVIDNLNSGTPIEDIITDISDYCIALDIVSAIECRGIVEIYAPELQYIVQNSQTNGAQFCALLLGSGCEASESVNAWTVPVPDGKPPVETPTEPEAGSPTTRVLQLSDFHLDLTYTVGNAASECGQILCCTDAVGEPTLSENAAGYWGGYACDTPIWMFQDMLEQIASTHQDIDYIMITGDYPAHDLWAQSRERNLESAKSITDLVKQVFPDTPIFPSLGNHESFPCNSFPPSTLNNTEFNPSWLYNALKDLYSDWLPQEALDTFVKDGYYTTEIMPGLRAIAVNSMTCYNLNFWLNYNWADANGQLAWLVEELTKAEMNGERVHILSHIPPGKDDCLGSWGREFENTITAQFYGHTHNDEYTVFYDVETNSRATSIGFIAPSVTPWHDLNPLTGSTLWMRVLESETYMYDMIEANLQGSTVRPKYFKLYDAKTDLG
ncbi:hypothetical protein TCAL_15136 [Tigriopus californicus]|uniref:Saposin B-type domain-containing protein n=1 Tax=Tigriopus californicus TaxID=6832 RepID=A0A553NVQ9_TIGCA|nr:hypothetical protein TCAL_15136 [Tigriopus californicus]